MNRLSFMVILTGLLICFGGCFEKKENIIPVVETKKVVFTERPYLDNLYWDNGVRNWRLWLTGKIKISNNFVDATKMEEFSLKLISVAPNDSAKGYNTRTLPLDVSAEKPGSLYYIEAGEIRETKFYSEIYYINAEKITEMPRLNKLIFEYSYYYNNRKDFYKDTIEVDY